MTFLGGAKKLSIAQAEKQQAMREQKQGTEKGKKKGLKAPEKKLGAVEFPRVSIKDLVSEFEKMRAITPYAVASKYNIRLSVAKDLLSDLASKNIIQLVAGNNNIKIYKVATLASA